jgi:hypothetical protein
MCLFNNIYLLYFNIFLLHIFNKTNAYVSIFLLHINPSPTYNKMYDMQLYGYTTNTFFFFFFYKNQKYQTYFLIITFIRTADYKSLHF